MPRKNLLISGIVFGVVCAVGVGLVVLGQRNERGAEGAVEAVGSIAGLNTQLPFVLVGLVALVIAVGIYRILREPVLLQEKIDARTQELQSSLIEAWLQKRQLQAAQDHVRGILGSTPDAVVAGTGAGIITEWNAAAERLYGWSRDEAVGRHIGFLLPPGARPVFEENATRLKEGQTVREVARRRRRDGSTFLAELTLSGFGDQYGQLRSWVAVVRDVTEEQVVRDVSAAITTSLQPAHAVRALVEPLHRTFGVVALGLTSVDDDGRLLRLVGVTADGRLVAGEDPLNLDQTAAAQVVRDGVPRIVRSTDTDPTLGPITVRSFVVLPLTKRGRVFATLTAGFDDLEPPSAQKTDLLFKVVRTITQDVANILIYERERETARGLKELDELKSDFLSTVSHELRTPLTGICGFAATLDDHWDDLEESVRRDFVRRVLRTSQRLDELIGGLLDFSRLENGSLNVSLRPCGLLTQLRREVDHFDEIHKTHRVQVCGDPELVALADPQALSRTLGNLLTNAAKFSPAGSVVTVRVARMQTRAVVSVTDEGVGIEPHEQERIFQRFYRVARGDRVVAQGTGIGLAIAKQFVEAQGGRIWLESEPGRGTTFYFTLRLFEEEGLEITEPDPSESRLPMASPDSY